jgi:transcriptional regulator with XRE-family HTH domain
MALFAPVKREIMPRRVVRMDPVFGDRLKEAMVRRRVRPGRMATDLGVRPQTVSRWRRGECPDDLRLPEIAGYLRVGLEWLKTGSGEFEPAGQALGEPISQRAPSPGRRREDIELRATVLAIAPERAVRRSVQALQEQATQARLRVLELHKAGEITPALAEAWLAEIQRFLSAGEAHESF